MHALAILMGFFMMLIGVVGVVFWVWTLIDCVTNKRITDTQKVVWTLVILFIGFIGSLIYFFAGRSPRVYIQPQLRAYQPRAYQLRAYQPRAYQPRAYQPEAYQPGAVAQPQPAETISEPYHPYQEGYRAQEQAQAYQPNTSTITNEEQILSPEVSYEQIQISYPE